MLYIKFNTCSLTNAYVTGTPILTKDWKWDITLNWGLNRTECIELGGGIKRYTLGSTSIASVVINEGGKYGDIVATNAYQRDANGNILIGDDGLPLTETDKVIGNKFNLSKIVYIMI